MKSAALLGNRRQPSPKSLADLNEGDQVAEIDREDKFVRMHTIKRRTAKLLWLSQVESIRFDGTTIRGRRRFRIPNQADKKKHQAKKDQLRRWQQEQDREEQTKAHDEYQLAKWIGWELMDGAPAQAADYLAFAQRIGLAKLQAFKDSIEEAKRE